VSVLSGDPASCSQAGGSLRRLATGLRDADSCAAAAFAEVDPPWPGRASTAARRSRETLSRTTLAVADEIDRVGSQLQDHAADLAEAVQAARHVEDRAAAAGLRLVEGAFTPVWGVTGIADESAVQAQERARATLQAELDTTLVQIGRRRARLAALAEASGARIREHTAALRH
jgi:hypothetical protein